ncbi:uncharacterized protein LOC134236072, partial [Saccostrea cucullata]|uniref:uncharacterized protein LOC134236072 n=1 Tax=Saccostrea cuccullata TaxID=36930 RepID=UPI002ED2D9EC
MSLKNKLVFICFLGVVSCVEWDNCTFKSGRFKGCPHDGMCIPFGKEWAVREGKVIRCVGNKDKFYIEIVKGGFCKDYKEGFKGCIYQGLCQPFDFDWKNFEGATLRCTKDKNKGYKIITVKPGFCRDEQGGYIGCIYDTKCHPFGKTWMTRDCHTVTCAGNRWSFRTRVIKEGKSKEILTL